MKMKEIEPRGGVPRLVLLGFASVSGTRVMKYLHFVSLIGRF